MQIPRMDLDGKGTGSPDGLVRKILTLLPGLAAPVPIEDLCKALDIQRIEDFDTDAFEGCLITDVARSSGVILAKPGNPFRRRFTIAHELGHFLIPTHMPDGSGRFLCSRDDMRRFTAKQNDNRIRMEAEANRFASLILMPPNHLVPRLGRHPSLSQMCKIADQFEVSKEAMARAYVQYHDKVLAVVFVKDGKVRYSTKGLKFPYLNVTTGNAVPHGSAARRRPGVVGTQSEFLECIPEIWVDLDRAAGKPAMYEQVFWQRNGFAMVLLWVEDLDLEEDAYEDEDLTARQRYARQLSGE